MEIRKNKEAGDGMAYIKNPTEEQKRDWGKQAKQQEEQMQAMIKNLAESYRERPENIAELLSFGSKFYRYSVRNNMLIYSQNPYATYVQSFKAWKDLGYPPKKGEHGLKVYVPVQATILKIGNDLVPLEQATKEQKIKYKAGEIESTTRIRFKLGTVFDIAQTTYPKEKYPSLFFVGYPPEVHHQLTKGLSDFAREQLGCEVNTEDMKSISLRGSYSPGIISINERLEDTQKLSTLAHELGHAIMQHDHTKSTAQKELEADSLGIMMESYLGLEIAESRKRHLADNYRIYQKEYEAQPAERATFGEVLKNVFQSFKKCETDLKECLERYVPVVSQKKEPERKQKLNQEEVYDEIKRKVRIQDYAAMHGYTASRIGKYYTLKEHNSVRIDPDKNCFWRNSGIDPVTHQTVAENASGSVIDFALMFVHNGDLHGALSELQEMIDLNGYSQAELHRSRQVRNPEIPKKSLEENLPKRATNMRRAFAYLTKSRYIDPDVVQDFVDRKMLYQDIKGNCVFVAYGKDGNPNFATFRGTLTEKRFLGDVPGNDYTRGFYIDNGSDKVIVTESVIDAMSVMTILKGQGVDYHDYDYSIEAGTGKSATLMVHLQEKPIKEVFLSMDHDVAGVSAMSGLKRAIEEQEGETKVTYHVPEMDRNDWNGELSYAAKKLQPMDSIPYLEEKPLPKIHYCAVQSTEQIEERGFRKRDSRNQYRLVEEKNGEIQPMNIKQNVIFTDPKELKSLVPPMYIMTDYAQLEKATAEHVANQKEQKNLGENKRQEGNIEEAVEGKLGIKEFAAVDGICMAVTETAGRTEDLAVWKRGEQFYIETGYAFDGSLEEHFLEGETLERLKEHLGCDMAELPDGLLLQERSGQEVAGAHKEEINPQAAFLEKLQKQEQSRNRQVIARQPGMSMEIEL